MYSIKKVSELVGIPAVTIRAWENRYHFITPTRTEGGHRLYSKKDIETLKWLKEQVQEHNVKISEAVRLLAKTSEAPKEILSVNTGYEGVKEQLYQALIQLDSEEANRITDLAFTLFHYEEVLHHILAPILYRIGDEWEKGSITVAQEHFSSQFILNRCTQFFRILPINPDLPRVLAFCPEGELHHIGLMLFSLFLRKKGYEVIYLGPNTPLSGLSDLIKAKEISIIAISMTTSKQLESVKDWVQSCQEENLAIRFILGGHGMKGIEQLVSGTVSYPQGSHWEDWYASFVKG